MKNTFALLLLILSATLFAQESPAQGYGETHAFEINEKLGRGVNLGNGFESPRGNSWGLQIKNEFLEIIAERGFSHVRIPIRWNDYAATSAPYTIEPWFVDTIKKVVDAALENKLLAIINMHHYDDFNDNPTSTHRARFLAIWKQISIAFKDYPDSLLFEFLNEPHQNMNAASWNSVYKQTLDTIRLDNPTRMCVVGPPDWNGVGSVDKLEWASDTNLIMSVHYYNPFHFTHQGASWVEGSDAWLGTKWDSTEMQRQAVINDFTKARAFSETNNVPVHVGEFGAYSVADKVSRRKWTSYCARTFESFGFSWAYWEFGSSFGVYDPANGIWRNFLLNALTEQIDTNSIEPEPWEVRNGGFTNELLGWTFQSGGTALATAKEISGEAVFSISQTDESAWHVQFYQSGIKLIQGGVYRISYDAWTAVGETAKVSSYVGMTADPYTYYAGNSYNLNETKIRHSFEFSMTHATDNNVRIVFDLGFNPAEIHLDNIVIEQLSIPVMVERIEVGPEPALIDLKGESLQLLADALPAEANNKAVSWEIVLGQTIATISDSGVLTAVGNADGEVRVKVTAADGSDVSSLIFVQITNQLQVESIVLTPTKTVIDTYKGSTRVFNNVLPANASNKNLLWEITQGENLAEVTSDGFIKALGTGDGEIIIKVSATDGSSVFSEVIISLINQVMVESVQISSSSLVIDVLEGTLQLYASVLPENASRKEVAWKVIDGTSKVSINQDGLLSATGYGNGLVRVRASANDGSGVFDEEEIVLSNQGVGMDEGQMEKFLVWMEVGKMKYTLPEQACEQRLFLYSMDGKLLENKLLPPFANSGYISMEGKPAGLYIVELESGDVREVIKVLF